MLNNTLNNLQNLISSDLSKLETCNLIYADNEKYLEFKNRFESLSEEILYFEDTCNIQDITLTPKTTYTYINKYAILSSDFEFYLTFLGGAKKITNYQINRIKINFESILKKINKNNYHQIKEELENTESLYQKIMDKTLATAWVKDIISHIKYLIYKYTLSEEFIYLNYNTIEFIPYIFEEIKNCLNNPHIAQVYKDELIKYDIDSDLINNNFNKILMLIIFAENNYDLTKEEINIELNRKYFKEKDIIKQYKKPKNLEKEVNKIKNLNYFLIHYNPELFIEYESTFFNHFDIDTADILNFTDYKILTEAVITNNGDKVHKIFDMKQDLKKKEYNYDYEVNCGIIACLDILSVKNLDEILNNIDSDNIELIRHLSKIYNNNSFIHPFIDKIVQIKDKILLTKVMNYKYISYLINIYLNNLNLYSYLLPMLKQSINKLSFDEIIEIIKDISYSPEKNFLLDNITNKDLKNEVDNYIYLKLSEPSQELDEIIGSKRSNNSIMTNDWNKYEAYYISTNCSKLLYYSEVEKFLQKYSKYKLNWNKLLHFTSQFFETKTKSYGYDKYNYRSDLETLYIIYKYCYQYDLETLKKHKSFDSYSSYFALEMINEFPQSIIYFIDSIDLDNIIKLPQDTLNIFITNFEKEYDPSVEGLIKILENNPSKILLNKVYTYIMLKGILTRELIDVIDKKDLKEIYKTILKNVPNKFARPELYRFLSNKFEYSYYIGINNMFLSYSEIIDYKNSGESLEVINLNLEKYAWDLIKNIDICQNGSMAPTEIVKAVAQLGFPKPIYYLQEHYPSSLNTLIEYTSNEQILQELEASTWETSNEEGVTKTR